MDGLIETGRDASDPLAAAILARLADTTELPAERNLAIELGVKRHRLRKALESLRRSGLLDGPPPRATTVKGVERWTQLTNPVEVIELRMMLEPGLARLAAVRASALDLARLRRAATPGGHGGSGAADLAFHQAIAACAGNDLAAELYAMLRRIGRDARLQLGHARPLCPARIQQRDVEHRAVVDAVAARDPGAAERAMRDHLAHVQRLVLMRLTPGTDVG